MNHKKIRPFLWFNNNLAEAIKFYGSVFKDMKVVYENKLPDGKVMTASFVIEGIEFMALDGGPEYKFTEAVSFFIDCKDQAEVDYYWEKLSAGGETSRCGWLKDQFGVSWQVIPSALGEYLSDDDEEKSGRVMQAMMKMDKIVVEDLKNAYEGKETA